MHFFEEFFQTVFVIIIFFDMDLDLLVTALVFWLVCVQFLLNLITGNFSISCWDDDWNKWLNIFLDGFCLNLWISEPSCRLWPVDESFLFDNDGLLDKNLFVVFWFNLPSDFDLFVRRNVANILLDEFLLKFGLDGSGFGLK